MDCYADRALAGDLFLLADLLIFDMKLHLEDPNMPDPAYAEIASALICRLLNVWHAAVAAVKRGAVLASFRQRQDCS